MLLDVFSVRCRTISSTQLSRIVFALQYKAAAGVIADPSRRAAGSTRATKQAVDQMAPRRCNLVDQYLAILLLVFAEAGLADVR